MDFKLNYYFELYKDCSMKSNYEFKKMFIDKHGKFQYLNELIIMINRYQVRKYGQNLADYADLPRDKNLRNKTKSHRQKLYNRFGDKEERNKRKIEYDRSNK